MILVVIACYVIVAFIVNKITKTLSNRSLRKGHFMLGLVCRCENNRLFLHHRVEMRPGFLGKWIEFYFHDPDMNLEEILELIKQRWHNIKYSEFYE